MCDDEETRLAALVAAAERGRAGMGTWLSIATGTTCLVVTIVGLILSAWAWRAKGPRSGLRGVAWSLLPIVMYLTGAIRLVGHLGSAIVTFAGSFVFSPKSWVGVILFFLAALLFLTTGGIPLLQGSRRRDKRRKEREARRVRHRDPGPRAASAHPAGSQADVPPGSHAKDDMSDVEQILRRRGIK